MTEGLTLDHKRQNSKNQLNTVDSYENLKSLNQDLTFVGMQKIFKAANAPLATEQMKKMHLIDEDGLFTNLGLLLSDQCQNTIQIALFQGTQRDILIDRYQYLGSLMTQVQDAYDQLNLFNRTRSEIHGLNRVDSREYPEVSIRETLLNAIVHKDYAFSSRTLISIFDNRMEFVTIGGLARGIHEDDLRLGVSLLRNPNLAGVFHRLKWIEAYGTGILKIIESYSAFSMKPKIETSSNAFKVTLPNTTVIERVGQGKDVVYKLK